MTADNFTKWIITMNPYKTFWLFGIFLPLNPVWIFTIGLYTSKKQGRKNGMFKISLISFVTSLCGIYSAELIFGKDFYNLPDHLIFLICYITLGFWFVSLGFASKYMIDYENRNNEYFGGLIGESKEYIPRFFQLFYLPISIYWIQQEVDKYE